MDFSFAFYLSQLSFSTDFQTFISAFAPQAVSLFLISSSWLFLIVVKSTISQQTQTDFQTQNKGTQTDLTASQITNLEQQNEQLLKLLQATEQELNNTKQQLQKNQELNTEQTKQLQSKIKLLEQQKENYQTKYDKSIEFIKEIREDIANNL